MPSKDRVGVAADAARLAALQDNIETIGRVRADFHEASPADIQRILDLAYQGARMLTHATATFERREIAMAAARTFNATEATEEEPWAPFAAVAAEAYRTGWLARELALEQPAEEGSLWLDTHAWYFAGVILRAVATERQRAERTAARDAEDLRWARVRRLGETEQEVAKAESAAKASELECDAWRALDARLCKGIGAAADPDYEVEAE